MKAPTDYKIRFTEPHIETRDTCAYELQFRPLDRGVFRIRNRPFKEGQPHGKPRGYDEQQPEVVPDTCEWMLNDKG
jgi:hypothetical protein